MNPETTKSTRMKSEIPHSNFFTVKNRLACSGRVTATTRSTVRTATIKPLTKAKKRLPNVDNWQVKFVWSTYESLKNLG